MANSSSVSDSGSSRTPVSIADSPSATDRNSGTTKNVPAWTRNMKRNEMTPLAQLDVAQHLGVDQRTLAALDAPVLPHTNRASTTPPPRMSQITGERPSHCGSVGLGLHERPTSRT